MIWVDATLRDSMPLAYERFVGPLTAAEREAYIVEGEEITARLRIPLGARPAIERSARGVHVDDAHGRDAGGHVGRARASA